MRRPIAMAQRRFATRLVLVAGLFAATTAAGQVPKYPERQTDDGVRKLMEAVDQARDRFEDQLDGSVKDSILRSPSGEVSVSRYLDDFQENVKKMRDRFDSDYAASSEVATVLQQGTAIDRYFSQQTTVIKGHSEWDQLATALRSLSSAYHSPFPLPDGAAVRRMNDKEVAQVAHGVAEDVDAVKDEASKNKAAAKPQTEELAKAADDLRQLARNVEDRLKDSKPATAETDKLLTAGEKFGLLVVALPATDKTAAAWGRATSGLSTLRQAFDLAAPAPRP